MKGAIVISALCSGALASDAEGSPIGKVIQMISDLQTKVIGEGEVVQKEYDEFSEWCEEQSKNLQFEIKTGKGDVEELTATIEDQSAKMVAFSTEIEEHVADIAKDEAELKEATDIRVKEKADFVVEEKELVDTLDTLQRAVGIIEREMSKGGASMMQIKSASNVAQALTALVQAEAINSADATRLTALVQSSQESDDEELGAPAVAAYKGQSSGIVDTLNDLVEKGEAQLDESRKKESTALNKFEMVAQSLNDEIKVAKKGTAEAKKNLAASEEKKASATAALDVTSKDLAEDKKAIGELHQDCMGKAQDFEAETKARGEELAALAKAKEIIIEATGGAASFLQLSRSQAQASSGLGFEVVKAVRALAQRHKSTALAQLASRISMRLHSGNHDDVFGKIKGLIQDMIEKLNKEAEEDATEKAFCDKELSESNAKREEQETTIDKLSTKLDQAEGRSAKLKEEVATLSKELGDLAASQAEMDKMRAEEKATFTKNDAETSKGLDGISLALKTLKEYYAKADSSSEGAAGGIVSLLEVCESDFSKQLAELRATEDSSAKAYETESKENEIEKATKDQDVKFKTKESVQLDKSSVEMKSDRAGVQTELDAVNEYLDKIKERCIAKPESYEDKVAAREAEIAGLKEALQILDGEASLLQRTRRSLRVIQHHA